MLAWVRSNVASSSSSKGQTTMREVSASVLDVLVERHGHLAVVFAVAAGEEEEEGEGEEDEGDARWRPLLEAAEKDAITAVRVRDAGKAMQIGLPENRETLVYFEGDD